MSGVLVYEPGYPQGLGSNRGRGSMLELGYPLVFITFFDRNPGVDWDIFRGLFIPFYCPQYSANNAYLITNLVKKKISLNRKTH